MQPPRALTDATPFATPFSVPRPRPHTSVPGGLEAGLAPSFPAEAVAVLHQLRSAITKLFESVPGGLRKSRDVQKLLGVDARLSWQIFKLAGPGDALSLAPNIPGSTSMRRLLDAAKGHGIAERRVE